MRKEKLGLEHEGLLRDSLKNAATNLSEYSFPSLYLFREVHGYEVLFEEDTFVTGITYDGESFLMPTRDVREMPPDYLRRMIARYGMLFPVPEAWLPAFEGGGYSVTANDGDTDYVHAIEKLDLYPGKKLHSKRNLLKQFLELYDPLALPLTEDRLGDARKILEDWQRDSRLSPAETDYGPCSEALDLYERLILCGGIFYADGEPAGFIIGEELSEHVFGLHFAKGRIKFKGIYQYIFNKFAGVMPAKYCSFNFEQDMGKESLRQAKSSYKPEWMLKKYRVSLKT